MTTGTIERDLTVGVAQGSIVDPLLLLLLFRFDYCGVLWWSTERLTIAVAARFNKVIPGELLL